MLCTWSKDYVKYIGRNLVDASLAIRPWTDCARIGWDVIRRNPSEAFRIVFLPSEKPLPIWPYSVTANRTRRFFVICLHVLGMSGVPGSGKIHVRENHKLPRPLRLHASGPPTKQVTRFTATSTAHLASVPPLKTLPVLLYLTFRTLPVCPMCLFL